MITIAAESVSQVSGEIQPLLEQHYQELTLDKEHVKLEVDWGKYESLQRLGMLAVITARRDGELVGYSVFILHNHMHYKHLKVASNDVLFLTKECRRGTLGLKLIAASEKHLAELGVAKVMWHIKCSLDWSKILLRMGYKNEEIVMGKLLENHHGL